MARIDAIYDRLRVLTADTGIQAGELAQDLGLARSNVSGDLNRLCDEGRAKKEGSKPVLYKAMPPRSLKRKSVFDRFTQTMPSLYQACEQAKAAILYPPAGMPMLLIGETGVGKSKFAESIFEYAKEARKLSEGAPFVAFNCADYANNPQLLVSQLFGCKKGAFTGADADRPGLIEKAAGGILFLDEVHRLPPEGQETLFTFFDRGCYRRLGDADAERMTDVLIITATTEQPASALLRTFTRRIPMVIRIPSLAERGLDERFSLVKVFFTDESRRLGKPVRVSVNAMRAILAYPCPNNLGQLRSDIQLLCAKAYSDLLTNRSDSIEIATANLPPNVKEGFVTETCHRRVWNSLSDIGSRFLAFDAEASSATAWPGDESAKEADSVYDLIDMRVRSLAAQGAEPERIIQELDADIRGFFDGMAEDGGAMSDIRLRELVGEDIVSAVESILAVAEIRLGNQFTRSVKSGLSIHLLNLVQRLRSGLGTPEADFGSVRKRHPDEFAVALECIGMLDKAFGLSVPFEEAGFLATFLALSQAKESIRSRPAIVVMAHGDSTATSMAKTCNELLGIECVFGIDVPLSENPRAAYSRLKEGLVRREPRTDVVLLVDMGSLTTFGPELERDLGVAVKTVTLASTMHVLQAARKSLMGLPAERIYDEVSRLDEFEAKGAAPSSRDSSVGFVVAVCTTGEGTAAFMTRKIESALDEDGASAEIVAFGAVSPEAVQDRIRDLERRGRVYCVVSPFRLGLPYPEFGVEDVLDDEGLARIVGIVREESLFDKIVAAHAESITALKPRDAFEAARALVRATEDALDCELYEGVRVGVYCHIASALDRAKKGMPTAAFPQIKSFKAAHRDAFYIARNEASALESRFGLRLSDDDMCYIVSFFDPDNCSIASLSTRETA